jgi:hypothetical protein
MGLELAMDRENTWPVIGSPGRSTIKPLFEMAVVDTLQESSRKNLNASPALRNAMRKKMPRS